MGTKESTAAPPFVITFTICSSDFVFFIPDVASFLSGEVLTGAPRLAGTFFFGESAFIGVGAFGGETFAGLGLESLLTTFPPFPAFPFVATTFYGLLDLMNGLPGEGAETDREFLLLSLLLEVAGRAFLA